MAKGILENDSAAGHFPEVHYVLVLVWNALVYASNSYLYNSLGLALPNKFHIAFDCAHFALWLLLPVTGWVAEAQLGRH